MTENEEKMIENLEEPKAELKVIVKQPKVQKPEKEKKEMSEARQAQMIKMREARQAKNAERKAIQKDNEELERKQREDAVKKAEEEAKKLSDNVEVQKVRGRKVGSKIPYNKPVRKVEPPPPQQLSRHEMQIMAFRQQGIYVPDNASPYMLKMIASRFR